eukprot:1343302-Amorphochlora_amoeboformis.AAC.1
MGGLMAPVRDEKDPKEGGEYRAGVGVGVEAGGEAAVEAEVGQTKGVEGKREVHGLEGKLGGVGERGWKGRVNGGASGRVFEHKNWIGEYHYSPRCLRAYVLCMCRML